MSYKIYKSIPDFEFGKIYQIKNFNLIGIDFDSFFVIQVCLKLKNVNDFEITFLPEADAEYKETIQDVLMFDFDSANFSQYKKFFVIRAVNYMKERIISESDLLHLIGK